ncbi:YraN family protein [Rhizobium sp. AC44/96]|uniref:YraN family protein n=1 Tax=unclassified Rhizobium TaxID=2613769 RepID=UPI00080F9B4E|nr:MULTISPECIES: YraN family protein [unclassified Rhizobium]MDM9619382.1 YraN family protein [Rhizobium sp. S96]OCJ10425.1 YraN family protein [Rhizobium sp. AC44/96]
MVEGGAASNRRRALRRGHVSEYLAALFLMLKGYRIVALRYRTKLGEIDIIARKRNVAVFVEVKARRDEASAVDAVSYTAQNRIRAASDLWLARQRDFAVLSQRYDIIAIIPGRLPRHFPDAF